MSVDVTTGAVSVRPYPSKTWRPVTSSTRCSTAAGSGAAPDRARRTEVKASSTSGSIDQATYIGGAPTTLVTPVRRTSASVSTGSKRSTSTPVAPWRTTEPSAAFRP
jgi:hypothetical protein